LVTRPVGWPLPARAPARSMHPERGLRNAECQHTESARGPCRDLSSRRICEGCWIGESGRTEPKETHVFGTDHYERRGSSRNQTSCCTLTGGPTVSMKKLELEAWIMMVCTEKRRTRWRRHIEVRWEIGSSAPRDALENARGRGDRKDANCNRSGWRDQRWKRPLREDSLTEGKDSLRRAGVGYNRARMTDDHRERGRYKKRNHKPGSRLAQGGGNPIAWERAAANGKAPILHMGRMVG
jgi:hypothetical protein